MSLLASNVASPVGFRVKLVGAVAAFGLAVLVAVLWRVEPEWQSLGLALAAFFCLWGCLFALMRRVLVSQALTLLVFGLIWVSAEFKYAVMAMNIHVYDAMLYLTAFSKLDFFIATFPRQAIVVATGLLVALLVLLLLHWSEQPKLWTARSRLALAASGFVLAGLAAIPYQGRNVPLFLERHFVFSGFFASFGDLPDLIRFEGGLRAARASANRTGPPPVITCTAPPDAPDIIMMLNESAMPPGIYPEIRYPEELRGFFASIDGAIRPLRVETFGGGTWLTDFSALTGLPTRGFGSLQTFAGQLMTGRIRHSLPQYLKACGYETTMVYPTDVTFAGTHRLYESLGFDRIIDVRQHEAPDARQRDSFYLSRVADILAKAGYGAKRKPQFIVASSMASHGPWDFHYAPEAARPGETLRWNADPEMDEYLWRLLLAKRDRDAFRDGLRRDLPDRRILFVDYGDHQPSLAAMPLKSAVQIADGGKSWQLDPTSQGFETYYAIAAQGFVPSLPLRDIPILEAAHLPVVTIMAAGLPLDPVMAERERLMRECRGLFLTCADKGRAEHFQSWLAQEGWVSAR